MGELDLASEDEALAALWAAMDERRSAILIDLQGLSFMDSTGVRCLLEARRWASELSVRLGILNGSGVPHRTLKATGVAGLFEMFDDAAEMRASLGSPLEDDRDEPDALQEPSP